MSSAICSICESELHECQIRFHYQDTCVIEFDGASKGNPGIAGAGVLLRAADGRSVCNLSYT